MRSGACTLQQTLTAEAASVLKHSLGLARRRGHAQVTPLHVAATLLSLRASSLRRACLKSQPHQTSHPLQCRALELCFNVALNRLPTTPGPLLHTQPSLSNALIAALKRAQAHQRRGCIEQQQQQPLLTIKVELEQLIISILDDPSVSRVMREAGFSSTAVKSNIEDTSSTPSVFQCYNTSGGVFSSPCSPSPSENTTATAFRQNHFLSAYTSSEFSSPFLFSPQKKASVFPITESPPPPPPSSKEDIKVVLDVLLRKKKRNTVIVGDSVALTEGLVGELMGKLERGDVPDELKSTHFIKFQLAPVSLRFMKREEVEMSLSALKRKVDSVASGGGAIFYVGDLKWTVEAPTSSEKDEGEVFGYNPVNHLLAEIGKLFCDSNTKVWLVATASYQTYMRCQMKQPPLETQWALQAIPVPSGGLGLSLHASSVHDSKMTISQNPSHMLETKLFSNSKEEQDKLNCCEECASNYEKEAQLFKPDQKKLLPSWLQSHTTAAHQKLVEKMAHEEIECFQDELRQLKRKWNRLCHCLHQSKQSDNHWSNILHGNQSSNAKIYPYNSSYPWWPNQGSVFTDSSSISFADSPAKPAYSSNIVPRFRRQQSCTIEFNFSDVTQRKPSTALDSLKGMEGNSNEVKITLALGNSTFGGSGQTVENIITTDRTLRRAHICKLLQENVPWQSETVPSIAEALVDSKSAKQSATTWLLLQGTDSVGKTRLARAIAESVFGSVDVLLHLDMLKNSATPFAERVAGALKSQEKLVILIENLDFADAQFRKFLADGFESGNFGSLSRTEESSGRAIFILTNGDTRGNGEQNNKESVMKLVLKISETKGGLESSSSSPCSGEKRKGEVLDLFSKVKNRRVEGRKVFSRHSSFNNLDLNMKADEEGDENGEEKTGGSSPISSDLTRETVADPLSWNGVLESIENRFELNESAESEREVGEMLVSKMKEWFEEVYGKKFTVEERVIEEIGVGCGNFTNSMFEKWLKDIFQSSLQTVNFGGVEGGIGFTLCWDGKGDSKWDNGFMGSCLPKNLQVNYFMD
ncbi:protein SMAX1-LIKE 4 isoform X1 [Vigna radiata var. radiata]|uniref:Protein SMAX1-LIKE 4 isoform X1 n=1 Tax=Vigna radiata var. radiata TaxID=3916 RepID=A0A1S3U6P3_VIGRR|nr:protein SMAX1-LIKE 4 isoform X1 [Vigna radiata var. radiata]